MKNLRFVLVLVFILIWGCNSNEKNNQKVVELELQKVEDSMDTIEPDSVKPVYVAISTMISPKRTFFLYENMLKYIEEKINVPIKLKQRKTYQEVNDLLEAGRLDFAYVCSGAYVVARRKFPLKILAAPKINNKTYYQAYIIVNKYSHVQSFEELEGASFAFSDPLSNSGYKYVIKLLKEKNTTPEEYFTKTIFTYAHDYSIQAVARDLVDGATVDGLVYDYLLENEPQKVKDVRIIHKSPLFAIPPFVYSDNSDPELIKKIRNVLLTMHKDSLGQKVLNDLNIDSFELVDESIYDPLEKFN
ncbi:MAG: phosphate/phosphite/phosphonate ABC transporter substrate-binding protein [Ignavibacteria bacterium]|nr:MAG: phosphate/phosphite/phosphonate ABC transporter substrate-binding protein [Ignavibacteria bacterium]